jgi:hypothetical protein
VEIAHPVLRDASRAFAAGLDLVVTDSPSDRPAIDAQLDAGAGD